MLYADAELPTEKRLRRGGAKADEHVRFDRFELGCQPGPASVHLARRRLRVQPPLSARRPLEVLYRISDINCAPIDAGFLKRPIKHPPGRTDEWLKLRGNWDLDLFVESIPFDETRHYTQSVLGRWAAYRWLYGSEPAAERMPYLPLTIPGRAD